MEELLGWADVLILDHADTAVLAYWSVRNTRTYVTEAQHARVATWATRSKGVNILLHFPSKQVI